MACPPLPSRSYFWKWSYVSLRSTIRISKICDSSNFQLFFIMSHYHLLCMFPRRMNEANGSDKYERHDFYGMRNDCVCQASISWEWDLVQQSQDNAFQWILHFVAHNLKESKASPMGSTLCVYQACVCLLHSRCSNLMVAWLKTTSMKYYYSGYTMVFHHYGIFHRLNRRVGACPFDCKRIEYLVFLSPSFVEYDVMGPHPTIICPRWLSYFAQILSFIKIDEEWVVVQFHLALGSEGGEGTIPPSSPLD